MAKQAKKTGKAAKKTANVSVMPSHPLAKRRQVQQLVASAPHFKFDKPGDGLVCKVLSAIIPNEGEFKDKLIGWNVQNADTGETVMIGNTHQIEKAFKMPTTAGGELWSTGVLFQIVWNGKSGIGNGRTFNNFDIGLVKDENSKGVQVSTAPVGKVSKKKK